MALPRLLIAVIVKLLLQASEQCLSAFIKRSLCRCLSVLQSFYAETCRCVFVLRLGGHLGARGNVLKGAEMLCSQPGAAACDTARETLVATCVPRPGGSLGARGNDLRVLRCSVASHELLHVTRPSKPSCLSFCALKFCATNLLPRGYWLPQPAAIAFALCPSGLLLLDL